MSRRKLMNPIKYSEILRVVLAMLIIASCNKPQDTPQNPNPPVAPEFTVDNKWECEVDGIKYSGTIDTSFFQVFRDAVQNPDTAWLITGTSNDKKANIHFKFHLNRNSYSWRNDISSFNALIIFDTLTTTGFLITSPYDLPDQISYKVDTLISNKLKATFSGTLVNPNDISGSPHTISNGKFSCEFGKGNNEPKTFSFDNDNKKLAGYFQTARLITNTLILEGIPYGGGLSSFKIQIRTGGTIKPGVYKNISGDATLEYYSPSTFRDFINDTLGSLTVTIKSVKDNIIYGSFTGINEYGDEYKNISNCQFSCRLQNYSPQADSTNKWELNAISGHMSYSMYGGNILNAEKFIIEDRYYLDINGESDFGASEFKIVVSSETPITTGVYQSDISTNRLNVLNFNSTIYDSKTLFNVSDSPVAYCKIDFIDDKTVRGIIYGRIINHTGEYTLETPYIKGKFQASF